MLSAMEQKIRTKSLTVRVPNDLWKSVKIKCVEEDTNIQHVVADFLSAWVEGRAKVRRSRGRRD